MSESASNSNSNSAQGEAMTVIALDKTAEGRGAALAALCGLYPTARVIGAASLRELEQKWSGPLPVMALVAFELDGENGLEAARRIAKHSAKTKVLVYARAMPESVRRELSQIGCGFMGAPVTADRILNALDCCAAEKALADRSATAQAFA